MHACDIRQYLICQNIFCTILPKFTLVNNLSFTVVTFVFTTMPKNLPKPNRTSPSRWCSPVNPNTFFLSIIPVCGCRLNMHMYMHQHGTELDTDFNTYIKHIHSYTN